MKKLLIILLSATLLTACNEKKLDVTSQDTLFTSLQEVSKDLNEADNEKFKTAATKLFVISTLQSKGDAEKLNQILKEKFDGKTASDVIKMAKELTVEDYN